MPIDFIDQSEKAKHVYELIGRCVTKFCAIEDKLLALTKYRTAPTDARQRFEKARTIDKRVALVDRAFQDREHKDLWDKLSPRVRSAAKDRNRVAHSGAAVEMYFENPVTPGSNPTLRWGSVVPYLREVEGKSYYDEQQLCEALERLTKLDVDLEELCRLCILRFNFKDLPKA